MKAIALGLIALSFSAAALANDAKCRQVTNTWNTHPNVPCPDYLAFCTEELEGGDMRIQARPNEVTNFEFLGLQRENHSDVGGAIFNAYMSESGMYMQVHFETDNNYPVQRTGGYTHISLSTGVRGNSGVYVSQLCHYDIN